MLRKECNTLNSCFGCLKEIGIGFGAVLVVIENEESIIVKRVLLCRSCAVKLKEDMVHGNKKGSKNTIRYG